MHRRAAAGLVVPRLLAWAPPLAAALAPAAPALATPWTPLRIARVGAWAGCDDAPALRALDVAVGWGSDESAAGVDIDGELHAPPMLAVKRTYQPSVIRKKRKHGFLSRNATPTGRRLLARRRFKGRRSISA